MTVADTLLVAGLLAGGASILGLGAAMLAQARSMTWNAGYRAGQIAGQNQAAQPPQPPAPMIVLTQPAQPVQPQAVDASWRPVQTERRFVIVGQAEEMPARRLTGGAR